ncbi:hypothetical protein CHS0354_007480 [Potamilus streckersoni]|uniref:Uncharacterized protein n=1 Tax=Potamilus streckersoni TaxID=2493646 RepID=A0AAE0SW57_9BIVA|nr:hypothetical protein CHS0354_007480 [Potamilus streckersoni]
MALIQYLPDKSEKCSILGYRNFLDPLKHFDRLHLYLCEKTGRRGQVTIERLVRFATGASREPLLGFSMNPTIHFAQGNKLILSVDIVDYELFDIPFLSDFFGLEEKSRMIYLLYFTHCIVSIGKALVTSVIQEYALDV